MKEQESERPVTATASHCCRLWLLELRPTPSLACSCPGTVAVQASRITSSEAKVIPLLVHIHTLSLFPRMEMGQLASRVPRQFSFEHLPHYRLSGRKTTFSLPF